MSRFNCARLLMVATLCWTASAQSEFSLQPPKAGEQEKAWRLPKQKLFESLAKRDMGTNALQQSLADRRRDSRACGHIVLLKPQNQQMDSKMVIPAPERQTSRMPVIPGLPSCSELK